jgi:protocatechuate 3,4-dioxygenase beta subunit
MACKINLMKVENDRIVTRRGFLAASLIVSDMLFYGTSRGLEAVAATVELEPTPACAESDDITPPQTAGPFYKPRSPERKSLLEPGIQGTRIVLEGNVRSTKCKPIQRALIDFWQADGNGAYDNAGFRLRGHQFADSGGKYRLETVVPGVYPGRTRHFHVRVQAPNRPALTTQLYFPGEPENKRDSIFNPKLVMALRGSAGAQAAHFDFVLDLG